MKSLLIDFTKTISTPSNLLDIDVHLAGDFFPDGLSFVTATRLVCQSIFTLYCNFISPNHVHEDWYNTFAFRLLPCTQPIHNTFVSVAAILTLFKTRCASSIFEFLIKHTFLDVA
jgi:hypothetical protein